MFAFLLLLSIHVCVYNNRQCYALIRNPTSDSQKQKRKQHTNLQLFVRDAHGKPNEQLFLNQVIS